MSQQPQEIQDSTTVWTTLTTIVWLLGLVVCLVSHAVMIASLSTDYWLVETVDRDYLASKSNDSRLISGFMAEKLFYFSRHRGLFKTCYDDLGDKPARYLNNLNDSNCTTETGFTDASPTPSYGLRVHLLRLMVALLCMALILHGLCVWTSGMYMVSRQQDRLKVSAALLFSSGAFGLFGILTFHGVMYLEHNKITEVGFQAHWMNSLLHSELVMSYSSSLGYSYMLAWCSVGLALLGGIFYLVTISCFCRESNGSDESTVYESNYSTKVAVDLGNYYAVTSHRNPAYEFYTVENVVQNGRPSNAVFTV